MLYDIPTDDRAYKRLLSKVSLRLFRSKEWLDPKFETMTRMYSWYRRISAGAEADRDYQVFLSYAFGLVERLTAKVTEPTFDMGLPWAVYPTRMKDGQKAANFAEMGRNWYAKPNQKLLLLDSKKEMIITGSRWEVDEWVNQRVKGQMWGQVPKHIRTPLQTQLIGEDGKPVFKDGRPVMVPAMRDGKPVEMPSVVMVPGEVPCDITTEYGFRTRYPSVFDMYPEKGKKTIGTGHSSDASYVTEDMGEVPLEALAKEFYTDPTTKAQVPLYNLDRMLLAYGKRAEERYDRIRRGEDAGDNYGPLITPVKDIHFTTDWGQIGKDAALPSGGEVDRGAGEDRDVVRIIRHHEVSETIDVANGRWIIRRVVNPHHVPGIKMRVECYTRDPQFLLGFGAIEPIEDELSELNLTHEGAMDNFFRIINKMLYVKEDAIVSWDDFNSRAGGKIRISSKYPDVRAAVADASQMNVVGEMLGAESNLRGLIEFATSNMDPSPGVDGTKANHKTARGMEEIRYNMDARFGVMALQSFINEANRGRSMQDFINQFHFEPRPYRLASDNGSTTFSEFTKDDIYTEGRPFEFVIEVDPLFGNQEAQARRELGLFDRAVDYERLRREMKDPEMPRVNLGVLFEPILKRNGWRDFSRIFSRADGEVSPEDELAIIMQGGVVECRGDLVKHIETHMLQLMSPNLRSAVESGKASPKTMDYLQKLIQQDLARLKTFLTDPQYAVSKRLGKLGVGAPPEVAA